METRTLPDLSNYLFTSAGEIYSLKFRRYLSGGTDKDGYRKLVLIDDSGQRRHVRRASLVCEAFHGPRPQGYVVRHLDGSRQHDAPHNLVWGTQKENMQDKVLHGTAQRGSANARSKLTEADVREIRASNFTVTALMAMFNVSRSTIYFIRSRRNWSWVQ